VWIWGIGEEGRRFNLLLWGCWNLEALWKVIVEKGLKIGQEVNRENPLKIGG